MFIPYHCMPWCDTKPVVKVPSRYNVLPHQQNPKTTKHQEIMYSTYLQLFLGRKTWSVNACYLQQRLTMLIQQQNDFPRKWWAFVNDIHSIASTWCAMWTLYVIAYESRDSFQSRFPHSIIYGHTQLLCYEGRLPGLLSFLEGICLLPLRNTW